MPFFILSLLIIQVLNILKTDILTAAKILYLNLPCQLTKSLCTHQLSSLLQISSSLIFPLAFALLFISLVA